MHVGILGVAQQRHQASAVAVGCEQVQWSDWCGHLRPSGSALPLAAAVECDFVQWGDCLADVGISAVAQQWH